MESAKVRTICIVSQNGSGKTSLAEAMLYTAKATNRLGRVDDKTSCLDFEPEEQKRRMTISMAFHHLQWKRNRFYLMDTPGEDNFIAEAKIALRVADATIFVVDAVNPIKPQTYKVWSMIKDAGLPVLIFVNKMDKERADFGKAIDAIKETLSIRAVPFAVPLGKEADFKGIVDLVQMKGMEFKSDNGMASPIDIPGELGAEVEELRNNLIEYAAESEDELLEKFLEGMELSQEEILKGLRSGVQEMRFVPVSLGSAQKNIGVSNLLDLAANLLPSSAEKGPVMGIDPETKEEISREPLPDAPFSGLVFKTMIDPYAGRLSIMRVFSGTLTPDGTLYNPNKGSRERYSQIFVMEGKEQRPVDQAGPGEIVAIQKLKEVSTGDSLCSPKEPIQFEFIDLPSPVLTYAIKPKSRADEEKINQALSRLMAEDPTLVIGRDQQTNELLISGTGQLHIDVTISKMKEKFGVDVDLTLPRIPYRETIKATKKGVIYRHKKQTGGAGQFAEVHFDISPLKRGEGFEFEEALVGMNVPRNFVPAVEKGIQEAMKAGPLAGYPVVDVKVRFYDGKSHEVDSSEMAFKIAAIQCFKKGVLEARPVLLEPICKITIYVPDENVGDIIGDLNSRRGRVMGMEPAGTGQQVVQALVPLVEVQRYLLDLNSMTQGRGTFQIEFSHYDEVPSNLAEKIIAQSRQEEEG